MKYQRKRIFWRKYSVKYQRKRIFVEKNGTLGIYRWRAIAVKEGIYTELTQRADDRKVGRSWSSRQGGRKLGEKRKEKFSG